MGCDEKRQPGHVERKNDADYVKACTTRLIVVGKAPVGRPRKTWKNTLSADICLLKVDPRDIQDPKQWRAIGQHKCLELRFKTKKKKDEEFIFNTNKIIVCVIRW